MSVIRGQSTRIQFFAWNVSDSTPKTGDAANITVYIKKDGGGINAAANTVTEVSSTYAAGFYEIVLTASEMDADTIFVMPVSSTSGVSCEKITIITDKSYISNIKSQTDQLTFATDAGESVVKAFTKRVGSAGIDSSSFAPSAITSNAIAANAITSAKIAADAITSSQFADSAINEIASAILANPSNKLTTDTNGYVTVGVNTDKSGYFLASSEHALIQGDVSNSLTNQGYTSIRAGFLDNLDAAVSSRLASSSYIAPDNASISAIKSKTDNITFTGTNINADAKVVSDKSSYSLASSEYTNIANAVFNYIVETGRTFLAIMRLISSVLLGKVSNAENNSPIFRDINDVKNRVTMVVDDYGNRTSVTTDSS